ncbi:MAG TPA: hypothetical protein VIE64_07995 [Solirubrobacterales bacterium]|jgi:hypothetical protein
MAPWKLPLVVAAIAVPIVGGFRVGGPGLGVAIGALAVLALLVFAARQRPREPIGVAPGEDARHTLIVVTCSIEEPDAVATIVREARLGGADGSADVRVLAPANIGFLDRWASDVAGARQQAQEKLVAAVAALAKAGVVAEGRVGDEDVVQAVEDQLQSYPADEVVLVSEAGAGVKDEDAARELGSRLRADFHHVALPQPESASGGNGPQS